MDGHAELEERVAEYLDRLEHEPGLTPEAYAAAHPALGAELLDAIRAARQVRALLEASQPDLPERIGPFAVIGRLGHGGMGVVYAVERDGRRFALKLLSPELAATPRAIERFQREARSLARLAHPGIVRVFDTGIHLGAPYLVMEHVAGPTLAELELPLAPERAARIVRDLALAVEAAHAAGVLHRDLKPANVILRSGDAPVLLDFGLVAAEDEATLTTSGALLGTPRYMAPEQAAGAPAERRTDVHGLGLILYELLLGVPARGEGSRVEVLERVQRGRVSWHGRGAVPEALERIVRSMLAREPRRRPASAALVAEELGRFLAGEPVRIRPPRAHQLLADSVRRQPLRALAGAAGVVALVLGARFVLRRPLSVRLASEAQALAARVQEKLAGGAQDEAVELALLAAERFEESGGDATAELPRLLALAEAREETLAALRGRIAAGDERALLPFALAYGLDSTHRLTEAAAAYERALALDPGLLRAHLNLAHLHAGAQLGACQACDRAFAAAPDMLSPERALRHLRAALQLDRGESEACVGRAVQTALALASRVPGAGALEQVAATLHGLLAGHEISAGARRRLEEGVARLRGAGGD